MAKLPHILVVNIFFAPFSYGGATVVAEEVSRSLVKHGRARVSALSLIARAELAPYTVLRAQVGGIDSYLLNVPHGRKYADMYDNPEIGEAIKGLLDEISPDLIHAHCIQEIGADLLRVAKSAEVPLVLSVHDFWWICERQFMVRMDNAYCAQNPVQIGNCATCVGDHAAATRRFDTLTDVSSLADIVTYPSQFALDLCEASGLAPGKGEVWQNGIHLPGPEFYAAQASRRAAKPGHVFGFLGGPSQIKGWPLIRRAFEALDRDGIEVLLVDGSRDGTWWNDDHIAGLPGTWRIIPRFEQPEMDRFYAQIDTLLFMSQWKETFGLAIREALVRGIGVLQTDSGGTTEHPAADPARLIPIGEGVEILQAQILEAMDSPCLSPVAGIQDFDGQARAFCELTAPLGIEYGPKDTAELRRPA
ncbi:MAG: glycosyltransferase [Rhodobacteraceae bacterium]|nr:glycosyltransferase [Paracoccaceae bacterium]